MSKTEQKQCFFCTSNRSAISYRDDEVLRKFISAQAKIYARKKSYLCAYHQRRVATSIKRARFMGLLPYKM